MALSGSAVINLLCYIWDRGGGGLRGNLSSCFCVIFKKGKKTSSLVRFALRAVLLKKLLFASFEPVDK